MMGWQTGDQRQLFYLFNLERRIPASHLLRRINPIVMQVLADLREKLAPFYSDIGRPSVSPLAAQTMPACRRSSVCGSAANRSTCCGAQRRAGSCLSLIVATLGWRTAQPTAGRLDSGQIYYGLNDRS
jgi:hypothetical protein